MFAATKSKLIKWKNNSYIFINFSSKLWQYFHSAICHCHSQNIDFDMAEKHRTQLRCQLSNRRQYFVHVWFERLYFGYLTSVVQRFSATTTIGQCLRTYRQTHTLMKIMDSINFHSYIMDRKKYLLNIHVLDEQLNYLREVNDSMELTPNQLDEKIKANQNCVAKLTNEIVDKQCELLKLKNELYSLQCDEMKSKDVKNVLHLGMYGRRRRTQPYTQLILLI